MVARQSAATLLLCLLFSSVVAVPAYGGVDDLPFEVRLLLAVDRQSNYSSTLARQASVAALDGASANPGAAAFGAVAEAATTVTASAVYAPSSGGREVYAAPVSFRRQDPALGTFAFAYAYTDTADAAGDDGLVHSLRSDEWTFGYGRRVADNASAGVTLRITSGTITSDSHADSLGGVLVRSRTRLLSPEVSVGVAASLTPTISAGMALGYSRAHADNSVTNLETFTVPVAPGNVVPVPAGSVVQTSSDNVATSIVRLGIGWQPDDATGIYLDAIGLHVASNLFGSGDLGRFALGAEHRFGERWKLLGGVSVDTLGNVDWSGGLDYRVGAFDATLALQTNAAPEVNREIGRTKLLSASLGWRF